MAAKASVAITARGAVLIPASPDGVRDISNTTAQLLVERTAYVLSDAIFDYSPEGFGLDTAVNYWQSNARTNLNGVVPEIHAIQTRSGAGLSLLGYLETAPLAHVSVLASSGVLKSVLPVLKSNSISLQKKHVVFNIAAVDFEHATGALESDISAVADIGKELGYQVIVSGLSDLSQFAHNTLLASALSHLGPVIHVYDGVLGTQQSRSVEGPLLSASKPFGSITTVNEAFEAVNAQTGANIAPVEYTGSQSAKSVLVGYGISGIPGLEDQHEFGALSVRLQNPFPAEAFSTLLPKTTQKIFVARSSESSGPTQLQAEVATTVAARFGFKSAPAIGPIATDDRFGLDVDEVAILAGLPLSKKGGSSVQAIVWDHDKSSFAAAIPAIARGANYASIKSSLVSLYDNNVRGGAVEHEVILGESAPRAVHQASTAFVNDLSLVGSLNVAQRLLDGGNLVFIASGAEIIEKALPDVAKKLIAKKHVKVFLLNLDDLDDANTSGRTRSFAFQSAFWFLTDPSLSRDAVTSRIVHSNSQDMELIAATVDKIVDAVKAKFLLPVESSKWAELDLSVEAGRVSLGALGFVPTSFLPAEKISLEEELSAESLSKKEAVNRVVFPEAYEKSDELRPDLPTTNYISKVLLNNRVTPTEYDRHIFHIELDITGTGLRYNIGEALGIHAPNNKDQILEFIDWYGIDADEIVGVPGRDDSSVFEYKTAFHALRDNMDIFGKVPKRFYEALAEYAQDSKQKAILEKLVSKDGAEELKRRTEVDFDNYVDALKEFDSARPPFAVLAEQVAPLKRREYSIASSQKMHPNAVHLLIVVVDWKDKNGNVRYGQCSKFLADLAPGAEVTVSVKPSVMKLPKNTTTPIIMAGLGTGLAPFKAFLEEKLWQRENGHEIGDVYLFLGSRHQREEYLYGELFEAYKNAGILTHIGAAFSRDQPEKIYIQHRISQAKEELIDAFVKQGGNFYLCGPTWPVPDISAALGDIVATEAASRNEKVDEAKVIEDLKDKERYILEVY